MFRLDKLTQKAQEAVQQCQAIAEKNESQIMFPLHLLIALAEEKEGIVRPVLEKCGVHPDAIIAEAGLSLLGLGVQPPEPSWGQMLSQAMDVGTLLTFPWMWIPPAIAMIGIHIGDSISADLDQTCRI